MTLKQFLKKYNRCPFCRHYAHQGNYCYRCKWRFAHGEYAKDMDYDGFDPKQEWMDRMNREVDQ